jgi:glycosyltransferase involved in cell wall biosynthesis
VWMRCFGIYEVSPMITVAICTLNRAESLRRTFESLAVMRVPRELDWEVVVVNNGCTDHTDEVIGAFAGRLSIRREFEPQRGLSRARNKAVEAARGDYIVWTDDDVIVDPGWLAAYAEAFRSWPEAAVFGGTIVPKYVEPMPKWLIENEPFLRNSVFSGRDFGAATVPLSVAESRLPYGPNFAVRTAEQRACRYNLDLGHAPQQQRRGEETDVVIRILQSGETGYWLPQARVAHCSDHTQQTLRYVIGYFGISGETQAFMTREASGPSLFGVPRWLWRQLLQSWVLCQFHRIVSPSPVWIPHLRAYASAYGAIRYWRGEAVPVSCAAPT